MAIDREKLLQVAQKHVDRKKYDRALETYQEIIRNDPNDARTLLKVGDLQVRMETYAEAIATYDRIAQFYASQGFALKAIAVYKQVRELIRKHLPQLADRYGHILPKLAEIYTELGLTGDALAAYDEVATRHQRNGRERDAIDVYRKMVDIDETNPLPHLRLAEASCRVQAVDDAVNAFWRAAELLIELQRPNDALRVVERILHFRQDAKYARLAAELYLGRGEDQDGMRALAKLQACFQADPKNLDTLELLAKAFTKIGQEPKAIEVQKEMASIARERGDIPRFEKLLAQLREQAPHDPQVMALAGPASIMPPASVLPPSSAFDGTVPGRGAPDSEPVDVEIGEAELGEDFEDVDDLGVDDAELAELEGSEDDFDLDADQPIPLRQGHSEPLRAVQMGQPHMGQPHMGQPHMGQPHMGQPHMGQAHTGQQRVAESRAEAESIDLEPVDEEVLDAEPMAPAEATALAAEEYIRNALIDAESFRGVGLYDKAVRSLRLGVDQYPESLELRERLRDLLLESGDHQAAAEEQVTLAAIYGDQGAVQMAESLLRDALDIVPNHAGALQMLAALGATIEAPDDGYAEDATRVGAGPRSTGRTALPTYDLEDLDDTAVGSPGDVDDLDVDDVDDLDELEDLEPPPAAAQARLAPSFAPPHAVEGDDLEDLDLDPAEFEAAPGATAPAQPQGYSEAEREAVEGVVEEADFFINRALYEDARAVLDEQLQRTPGHPLLLERLSIIDRAIRARGESGTRDRKEFAPAEFDEGDRAFDLAASLDAIEDLDVEGAPGAVQTGFAAPHEEVDVDQVFKKFKEGVRAQVADSDSATHYDLGVAYKEMGLTDDAIHEFELAARDPRSMCTCYAMIGMIYLEKERLDESAAAFIHALEAPRKTIDQEMSLYYDLGNVYEMKRTPDEALYYFQKIARRDPGFRDVKDRIAALTPKNEARPSVGSRAINDDDDFDAAFDDLFED